VHAAFLGTKGTKVAGRRALTPDLSISSESTYFKEAGHPTVEVLNFWACDLIIRTYPSHSAATHALFVVAVGPPTNYSRLLRV
jgi:hypothetical protein